LHSLHQSGKKSKAAAAAALADDEAVITECEHSPYPAACGLVYDERCLLHRGEEGHPERPARATAIIAALEKSVRLRRLEIRCFWHLSGAQLSDNTVGI
jgi:hypothetical protein